MARRKKTDENEILICVSSTECDGRIFIDGSSYRLHEIPKSIERHFIDWYSTTAERQRARAELRRQPEPQTELEPPKPKPRMVRARRDLRLAGVRGPLNSLRAGETRLSKGDLVEADSALVAANKDAFEKT